METNMESNIKIETLAARYVKLKADIDKANDELSEIKNQILSEMGENTEYKSKNYKITNSGTTRKNLQPKLIEEIFNIHLTDQCYTVTNSTRFVVKDIGVKQDNYEPVSIDSLNDITI